MNPVHFVPFSSEIFMSPSALHLGPRAGLFTDLSTKVRYAFFVYKLITRRTPSLASVQNAPLHKCLKPVTPNLNFCSVSTFVTVTRLRSKCDDTRAESRFRLSAKGTSPFKSAGTSFQSTAGSRGVRISGSNAGYTTFRGSVKVTGYPLHSPVSPSLPLLCVTVCHHISTGLYLQVTSYTNCAIQNL